MITDNGVILLTQNDYNVVIHKKRQIKNIAQKTSELSENLANLYNQYLDNDLPIALGREYNIANIQLFSLNVKIHNLLSAIKMEENNE